MTVFNRNDKATEPTTPQPIPVPPRENVVAPVHIATETRRAPVPAAPTPIPGMVSVISKALKITGQLESTEDIQIDGEIDGDVRGVSVKVGGNAKVKGCVYGESVEVAGTVDGKVEAKKVVLTSTARMSGDVIHQDITILSGAYIDGHCRPEYGKSDVRKVIPVHKPANVLREAGE